MGKLQKVVVATSTLLLSVALPMTPASAFSSCPYAFYDTSSSPSITGTSGTGTGYDLGVKFTTNGAAETTGIRFYTGGSETGPFTVHLDDSSGSELASATASAVGSSGWYEGDFTSPVSTPTGDYIAWRNADNGGNPYLTNGLLSGVGSSTDVAYVQSGSQGLYDVQPHSGAPSTTSSNNYFVSPVVDDSTTPSAPTVTTDVNATSVTIHVSGGYDGGSVGTAQRKIYRNSSLLNPVVGSASATSVDYVDTSVTPGTSYTYTATSLNYCGTESSPSSGSTVTASTEETVFGNLSPGSTATYDTNGVELGMRFTPSINGQINGVRFWRPIADSGYVANLWSDTGTNLATGSTLTGGSQSVGWNEIRFSSPVSVSANTTYVVSYYAPHGQYAYDSGRFASSGVTNGDLTAPQDSMGDPNGVYDYSGSSTFPTSTYGSTWYGVDAIFSH